MLFTENSKKNTATSNKPKAPDDYSLLATFHELAFLKDRYCKNTTWRSDYTYQ
jgi:hypothetical protein